MRLPRMTTRQWMVVVAALGLLLCLGRMSWIGFVRWKRAEGYERMVGWGPLWPGENPTPEDLALTQDRERRLSDFYRDKARRYRHAAFRPWLPVASDPPEPR